MLIQTHSETLRHWTRPPLSLLCPDFQSWIRWSLIKKKEKTFGVAFMVVILKSRVVVRKRIVCTW